MEDDEAPSPELDEPDYPHGTAAAGEHTVVWDGTDGTGRSVSSGTYVYRLITDNRIYHRTMTIAK